MRLAIFLAGCLISAPLVALEKEGLTITLTQEDDDACTEGGGCYLVPKVEIMKALHAAHAEGVASCQGRNKL